MIIKVIQLLLMVSAVYGAALHQRPSSLKSGGGGGGGPGYMHMQMKRHKFDDPDSHLFKRRVHDLFGKDMKVTQTGHPIGTLVNSVFQYMVELEIGTPGQLVNTSLDTGSSDLWVYGPEHPKNCFYNNASRTFEKMDKKFSIGYITGSVEGTWAKDTVRYGGATVEKQQMAVVDKDHKGFGQGIFGIGLRDNEIIDEKYPNFPESLKNQGVIDKNLYSLFLNTQDAETGSIIFGGIDHAKYTGQLKTVPLSPRDSKVFSIETYVEKYSNDSFRATLDCGTTFSYLPKDIADKMAKEYNATLDEDSNLYFTDQRNLEPLVLTFGNDKKARIEVQPAELFLEGKKYNGNPPRKFVLGFTNNKNFGNDLTLFGDTFMRSAYVVHDLDDRSVQLAQMSNSPYSFITPA